MSACQHSSANAGVWWCLQPWNFGMLRSLRSLHSQLRNFTRSLSGPGASLQESLVKGPHKPIHSYHVLLRCARGGRHLTCHLQKGLSLVLPCWSVQEGLPAHRVAPRKSRRGGSELTPILSADELQTPVDLLENAPPEDLLNEARCLFGKWMIGVPVTTSWILLDGFGEFMLILEGLRTLNHIFVSDGWVCWYFVGAPCEAGKGLHQQKNQSTRTHTDTQPNRTIPN